MKIDFEAFLETLPIMGKGMLGIFVVTGVIIGIVYLLNKAGKKLDEIAKKKNGQ